MPAEAATSKRAVLGDRAWDEKKRQAMTEGPGGSGNVKLSLVSYKQKTKVVRHVTLTVTFLLLLLVVFQPWGNLRKATIETVELLSNEHLATYTKSFIVAGSQFLSAYEGMTLHLSSLTDTIRCDQASVWRFILFGMTANSKMPGRANEFVMMHSDGSYCKLVPDPDVPGKFELLYLYNGNQLKRYSDQVNFEAWNPGAQGVYVGEFDWQVMWDMFREHGDNLTWSEKPLHESGDRGIAVISPVAVNSEVETIVSVLVSSECFWATLQSSNAPSAFNYAVLNRDNTVVIEKNIHGTKSQTVGGVEVFPKLSEIGVEIWRVVEPYVSEMAENSTQKFWIGEEAYLVTTRRFCSKVPESFKSLIVLHLSSVLEIALFSSSFIIVMVLVIVFVLCVIVILLRKRSEYSRDQKLRREVPLRESPGTISGSCGAIGRAICRLRNLEIEFPEEIVLNKVIDNAVINLAQPRERLFSLVMTSDCTCEFCKEILATGKEVLERQPRDIYSTWNKMSFPALATIADLQLDGDGIQGEPVRSLIRVAAKFIASNNLLLVDFDPDLFLNFIVEFANNYVRYPEHKTHMIINLSQLLSGPFHYWLQNRVDLLVVLFVALVKDISYEAATNAIDPEHCDVVLAHSDVFSDHASAIEREALLALHLLRKFIPKSPEKHNLVEYFETSVRDILIAIHDHNQFRLFTEFHSRVQSPQFSVHSDPADRLLFMKVILVFCDFCPYWSPETTMVHLLDQMKHSVFTEEEAADEELYCHWHLEVSNRIVKSWLNILTNFYPLEDITENFNHNVEYWQSRINEFSDSQG